MNQDYNNQSNNQNYNHMSTINPNIFPPKSSNIKAVIIKIIIFLGIIGALILLTRPDEKDTKKEKK